MKLPDHHLQGLDALGLPVKDVTASKVNPKTFLDEGSGNYQTPAEAHLDDVGMSVFNGAISPLSADHSRSLLEGIRGGHLTKSSHCRAQLYPRVRTGATWLAHPTKVWIATRRILETQSALEATQALSRMVTLFEALEFEGFPTLGPPKSSVYAGSTLIVRGNLNRDRLTEPELTSVTNSLYTRGTSQSATITQGTHHCSPSFKIQALISGTVRLFFIAAIWPQLTSPELRNAP
eukprot:4238303-Amphidinium_carterae.4